MNKVPHCKQCELCKEVHFNYKAYYCQHEGFETYGAMSVDDYPKTSPKWCPLRKKVTI